jgi:hypothetical protein
MKRLLLLIEYPDSVGGAEIKDYAQDALQCWGGQRHPEDHLFYTVKAPKSKMRTLANNWTWFAVKRPRPTSSEPCL